MTTNRQSTFTQIADQWFAHRANLSALGSIAPSTLANQGQISNTICAAIGEVPIGDLRKSHMDLFVAGRLKHCRPVTVAGEVDVLRQILNFAVDEQIIASRPRLPSVSVPNTEHPLPSDEDFAWFLRTMSCRHGDALQFMLLTGLAPHELERIETRDFSPVTNRITIGGRPDFRVKQESRRRDIPLNPAARAIWIRSTLGRMATHSPFPSAAALQKAMRRHVLECDDAPTAADGLTPKMMRKWFASKIAAEHSEAVLQRLLGHAPGSPITRRHYVRSSDDQLLGAVESLGSKAA